MRVLFAAGLMLAGMNFSSPSQLRADGLLNLAPVLAQANFGAQKDGERQDEQIAQKVAAQTQTKKGSAQPAEQDVLDFVGEHQPKLLELLAFLKERNSAQYQLALKEMSRSRQRLASLAKKDKELYAIELQLWQTRSELRLLAAEISVTQAVGNSGNEQLRALLERETEQEIARLKLLTSRAQTELERLGTQLESLTDARAEHIAKNMKLWQNRIAKQSRAK